MTPDHAKVFLVEDDPSSIDLATTCLQRSGHTIVETASRLDEALTKILKLHEKGVNVAIVDGNLRGGDESGRDDGERIAREIKAKQPEITVIGHATDNPISAADVNSTKYQGSSRLVDTVTSIPENTQW